ncbi:hypothetical protein BAUCODRAFT_36347 [Baudoinia panamericana UAMH 10762]|uniref:Uncharacterized protein n=1 Tax=Baudoinia panamericana (strain UAMH 10762) TaxID=717646 RepID=M2N4E9_BAUPA|nr:uncharacterized protein BAUCODRAFT_36347 [Baudoinia panamericana UAMH 10762]EMC93894.1 hypothetical protein BAUCODRAFT_36347 [Baudoinia panamericana UAMH 10762]
MWSKTLRSRQTLDNAYRTQRNTSTSNKGQGNVLSSFRPGPVARVSARNTNVLIFRKQQVPPVKAALFRSFCGGEIRRSHVVSLPQSNVGKYVSCSTLGETVWSVTRHDSWRGSVPPHLQPSWTPYRHGA